MSIDYRKILRDQQTSRATLQNTLLARQLGVVQADKSLGYKDAGGVMSYYTAEGGNAIYNSIKLTGLGRSGYLYADGNGNITASNISVGGTGSSSTGNWIYYSNTNPALLPLGSWATNNANPSLATKLYIRYNSIDNTSFKTLLLNMGEGSTLYFAAESSPTTNYLFKTINTPYDYVTYVTLDVELIASGTLQAVNGQINDVLITPTTILEGYLGKITESGNIGYAVRRVDRTYKEPIGSGAIDLCVFSNSTGAIDGNGKSGASGFYSITLGGANNLSAGLYSLTGGEQSHVTNSGTHGLAIGYKNKVTMPYASALGLETIANGNSSHVIGKYNAPNDTDIFQVGIGQSNVIRYNAFTISNSGSIVAPYQNIVGITDNNQLATKLYVDSSSSDVKSIGTNKLLASNGLGGWKDIGLNTVYNSGLYSNIISDDNITISAGITNNKTLGLSGEEVIVGVDSLLYPNIKINKTNNTALLNNLTVGQLNSAPSNSLVTKEYIYAALSGFAGYWTLENSNTLSTINNYDHVHIGVEPSGLIDVYKLGVFGSVNTSGVASLILTNSTDGFNGTYDYVSDLVGWKMTGFEKYITHGLGENVNVWTIATKANSETWEAESYYYLIYNPIGFYNPLKLQTTLPEVSSSNNLLVNKQPSLYANNLIIADGGIKTTGLSVNDTYIIQAEVLSGVHANINLIDIHNDQVPFRITYNNVDMFDISRSGVVSAPYSNVSTIANSKDLTTVEYNNNNYVKLTTDQSISGVKTFNNGIVVNNNIPTAITYNSTQNSVITQYALSGVNKAYMGYSEPTNTFFMYPAGTGNNIAFGSTNTGTNSFNGTNITIGTILTNSVDIEGTFITASGTTINSINNGGDKSITTKEYVDAKNSIGSDRINTSNNYGGWKNTNFSIQGSNIYSDEHFVFNCPGEVRFNLDTDGVSKDQFNIYANNTNIFKLNNLYDSGPALYHGYTPSVPNCTIGGIDFVGNKALITKEYGDDKYLNASFQTCDITTTNNHDNANANRLSYIKISQNCKLNKLRVWNSNNNSGGTLEYAIYECFNPTVASPYLFCLSKGSVVFPATLGFINITLASTISFDKTKFYYIQLYSTSGSKFRRWLYPLDSSLGLMFTGSLAINPSAAVVGNGYSATPNTVEGFWCELYN